MADANLIEVEQEQKLNKKLAEWLYPPPEFTEGTSF